MSAWNSAGTWEEKDRSAWAKQQIEAQLKALSVSKDGVTVSTTTVSKCTGHAQVLMIRGKKRAGFEYEVTFGWEAKGDSDGAQASGQATILDLSDSSLDDIELDIKAGAGAADVQKKSRRALDSELPKRIEEVMKGICAAMLDTL